MRILFCALAAACSLSGQTTGQTSGQTFSGRLRQIMDRPEYRHSRFGLEIYALDSGQVLFKLNADQLFVPGSTTKLVTVGTALGILGAGYRFHTRILRTGPIGSNGVLKGDLVLVASGDPNLSNRVQPDGSLAFENVDHSYSPMPAAKVVPGDPLSVIRGLAKQVSSKGITRVAGIIRIDTSLFPEGDRELGTGVVISPIVVNDNVVDVTITPGGHEGDAAAIVLSPETSYVTIVNRVKTGAAGAPPKLDFGADNKRGATHSVIVEGSLPAGGKPALRAYRVPEPNIFAATVLTEALEKEGIRVDGKPVAAKPQSAGEIVAEHVSPTLLEEAKVTLKVSQNLHASMFPFIVGAVSGHAKDNIDQSGFNLEHALLEKAGLDLTAAAQSDGAGGAAYYSPDFMVHFLAYISRQPYFDGFYRALPVLGKDGTLWDIQPDSPAAGFVHAKTGTYATYNALNKNLLITGKGLAGYLTTKDGQKLAFAFYANFVPGDPETAAHMVGDALGEIAAAAYDSRFEP